MNYLLDTCVVSELIKPKPNSGLVGWLEKQDEENLFLSVLTIGEVEKGVSKLSDGRRKRSLRLWIENDLKTRFEDRILSVNLAVACKWGQIQGQAELLGKPMPTIDGLIAATALSNNCVLVTRNVDDFEASGVTVYNPWLKTTS